MARTCEQIIEDINKLKAEDFDLMSPTASGMERLYEYMEELETLPDAERLIPSLFRFIERFPDVDLGSPGPIVHALERMEGRYEQELKRSIERTPTRLTLWMVNRLINGEVNVQEWLHVFRSVSASPKVFPTVRQSALEYIEFQRRKGISLG